MKHFNTFLLLLVSSLVLSSCDANESDDIPNEMYRLFPNGYFSEGFREEYMLSGTSPAGLRLEGTHLELTESERSFDGEQVSPIRIQNDWIDTQTNEQFSNASLSFYSTDSANRRLIGSEDIVVGIISNANTIDTIPVLASIGEAGMVGSYLDTIGGVITLTWRLEEADGEFARLVWTSEVRDGDGNLIVEGYTAYLINRDGDRQSLELLFDVKLLNDPVTWTGVKR